MADTDLYLCAGEPSGDVLGAQLMADLKQLTNVKFSGVGGSQMGGQGLSSLFDMAELSVMGFTDVLGKLPKLFALIDQTADDIIAKKPDCVIYIDAQDFSKRVAHKVRRAAPQIKQVLYVAPTVWAWRPGRAKKMVDYFDHVMAILPFEPAVMKDLQGPPTTYVGHPLLATIAPASHKGGGNNLLLLPGSRGGEIKRHMPIFAEVVKNLRQQDKNWHLTIPTLPRLKSRLTEQTNDWAIKPTIVSTTDEKENSFKSADAALAVAGTITLELTCAHIPQVVIYQADRILTSMGAFIKKDRISLPNVILAENAIPEYINKNIVPDKIAHQLAALATDTGEREKQLLAYKKVIAKMQLNGKGAASSAAQTLLALLA